MIAINATQSLLNFAPVLDHAEKLDICKDYRNPQGKMGVATHFFEIIGLEAQQKCWHQHFLTKKERIILKISLEFSLTHRKPNTFYKDLKNYLENGK